MIRSDEAIRCAVLDGMVDPKLQKVGVGCMLVGANATSPQTACDTDGGLIDITA